MKAILLRENMQDYRGYANLYELDPPMVVEDYDYVTKEKVVEVHTFVIVSAASPLGMPETYIFPATEEGEVTDWGELPGSYQGGLSHAVALHGAGYEIAASRQIEEIPHG